MNQPFLAHPRGKPGEPGYIVGALPQRVRFGSGARGRDVGVKEEPDRDGKAPEASRATRAFIANCGCSGGAKDRRIPHTGLVLPRLEKRG